MHNSKNIKIDCKKGYTVEKSAITSGSFRSLLLDLKIKSDQIVICSFSVHLPNVYNIMEKVKMSSHLFSSAPIAAMFREPYERGE